ncbi:MAG: hypothetical protein U0V03_09575 [Bacteroidia bacterium]
MILSIFTYNYYENAPDKSDFDWTQLIGTIIIPILVSFLTYFIAKKQITNAGVTQFRQQWIDNLRNCISEYISKAEFLLLEIKINNKNEQSLVDIYQDLIKLRYKIDLMLNPNEDDHKKIIEYLKNIRNGIYDNNVTAENIQTEIAQLNEFTKTVLKKEWNVVKSGK